MIEKEINISGTNINYFEGGNGKIIIFLHGWGQSSVCFLELAEKIKKGYKVFLLDLPGFGKSGTPDFIWNYNNYAKIVQEFCEKLDIKNPIIVGHSFGAKIAFISDKIMETGKIIVYSGSLNNNWSLFRLFNIYLIYLFQFTYPTLLFYFHNKFLHPRNYTNFFVWDGKRAKIMLNIYRHLKFNLNNINQHNIKHFYFLRGKRDRISNIKFDEKIFEKDKAFIFEDSGHFSHISEAEKFETLLLDICSS